MSRIPRNVSTREIKKVLTILGFELRRTTGSHILFYHPETKTTINLPVGERTVRLAYLSYMRKIIDERGIADRDEFDELLSKS